LGSWFQQLFDKRQEITLNATVLSRRVECARVVVFRSDCGEELELNVSEDQYRDLKEGLQIQLTKKGNVLLSFTVKK
jgi:hypothetical protein